MAVVRFNRDWQHFRSGQVATVGDGKADAYVRIARVAEYVEEPPESQGATLMTRRRRGPRENNNEERIAADTGGFTFSRSEQ